MSFACPRCHGEGALYRQDCGANGVVITCPQCGGDGLPVPAQAGDLYGNDCTCKLFASLMDIAAMGHMTGCPLRPTPDKEKGAGQ